VAAMVLPQSLHSTRIICEPDGGGVIVSLLSVLTDKCLQFSGDLFILTLSMEVVMLSVTEHEEKIDQEIIYVKRVLRLLDVFKQEAKKQGLELEFYNFEDNKALNVETDGRWRADGKTERTLRFGGSASLYCE